MLLKTAIFLLFQEISFPLGEGPQVDGGPAGAGEEEGEGDGEESQAGRGRGRRRGRGIEPSKRRIPTHELKYLNLFNVQDVIWMGNGDLYDPNRKRGERREEFNTGGNSDDEELRRLKERVKELKQEGAAMKEVRKIYF